MATVAQEAVGDRVALDVVLLASLFALEECEADEVR